MGGTTGCLATIVLPKEPAPPGTERLLAKLRTVIGRTDTGGAVLEGINAEVIQLLLIFIIIIIQGPIVNDLGGLPDSDNEMDEAQFETLINRIPSLKLMTISPHLEAQNGYKRLKLLIKKYIPTSLIYNNYFCLFYRGIKPSLGHDRVASEDEILGALRLTEEPLHITHLFNVCTFHHR